MKLYFSKGACSLAVRIIINEIAISCAFEAVNLKSKTTAGGADYRKINPKGSVPALAINADELLTENFVILQYLADSHGAKHLCPSPDDFRRYRVLEWGSFITSDLHKTIGALFNPAVTADLKENLFMPMIDAKLLFVDEQLEGKTYLLGKDFTIADAYLFVVLSWTFHFGIDLKRYPRLEHYFSRLKQRPSIAQSLQQEQISI